MSIHFGNVNTVKIDCQQIDCHCGACARLVPRTLPHIHLHNEMIAGDIAQSERHCSKRNNKIIFEKKKNFLLFSIYNKYTQLNACECFCLYIPCTDPQNDTDSA